MAPAAEGAVEIRKKPLRQVEAWQRRDPEGVDMILTEKEGAYGRERLAHGDRRHARRAAIGGARPRVDARLQDLAIKLAALACGYVAVRALIAVYWALWWVTR